MTVRGFLALDLDEAARTRLSGLIGGLRRDVDAPAAAWTKPHQLHLTLRFLGDLDADVVTALGAGLPSACAGARAPHTRIGGLSAFPEIFAARSLFAAIAASDALSDVAARVEALLAALGRPPDPRPFVPHVTLARCRPVTDARRVVAAYTADLGEVSFPRCTLYESRTTHVGSVYLPLVAVDLAP
jgi:2'-5' RNA ligase